MAKQQWYTLKNGHGLTKEILSGLREYYDAVDIPCVQRDVNTYVVSNMAGRASWDQEDYLRLKVQAENIVNNAEMLTQEEEKED